ncbi:MULTISPECIES: Zn-dependent hydrolase [unclassified Halomonas]|uniref:Zn-dependent hydrolase n=1 Tax=unclassified Halomonas TaxID=2609666 RepID=UPI0028888E3E|nr:MULTISPECIES: Zn-dependent hydrolase [unclassified Halomonas]MDT0501546.1 Zn-dependent hydrolase [Halomonas sp. PAR7]MDT0511097.1 Zn-dependent hydrolase [Halomonas sp. LES1]MDT0592386.1 Zn-dependent hydrolase [Halomonas sp. PAR8]
MTLVNINARRLWQRIMSMAEIGATSLGGSSRLALTDEDRCGRDLFIEWCRQANCEVRIDRLGNIFARRPGTDPECLPIACGSHLDTQPLGGRFDGVFGVLAGLEVLETLNDNGIQTRSPLEVCVWTNEEGARFTPPMLASGVHAGVYSLEYALARQDDHGISLAEALEAIGYVGEVACGSHRLGAFLEAHIEQGPVLEREQKTVGVVSGVQGSRWYRVSLTGQEAHTGSTPMLGRRDALAAAARLIVEVQTIADAHAPLAVASVGHIENVPNSPNTLSGQVELTIDMRHPRVEGQASMESALRQASAKVAEDTSVVVQLNRIMDTPPVDFHPDCIEVIEEAASSRGYRYRRMLSGAGHDACHLAGVTPTAMIFVPCAGGLSHNEAERAELNDLAAGTNVLLDAMLHLAEQPPEADQVRASATAAAECSQH